MSRDANRGNAQRPSRPRDATPPRAVLRNGRTLRFGFGPRLAVALGLTLALVSGVGYVQVTRVLERRVIQQEAVYQRAQAEALEAVADGETPKKAMREIAHVMQAVSQRPGRRNTALIDSTFTIVAANDQRLVGTAADPEARVTAALKHGRSFAGREGDPRLDVRNFEFVTPVELPSGRFVFEASYSHQFFDAELSKIRRSMALIALLGLLGGGVVFYLVGGRGLTRSHRFALERATLDGLTDLPNQRAFHDDLEHAVALAARHGESLALAVLDLDDFKFLNDRHGHRHGDELLLRWRACSTMAARATARSASAVTSSRCCSRAPTLTGPRRPAPGPPPVRRRAGRCQPRFQRAAPRPGSDGVARRGGRRPIRRQAPRR